MPPSAEFSAALFQSPPLILKRVSPNSADEDIGGYHGRLSLSAGDFRRDLYLLPELVVAAGRQETKSHGDCLERINISLTSYYLAQ